MIKNWKEYTGHNINEKEKYDQNIYTFDIETSSYFYLDGVLHPSIDYNTIDVNEKQKADVMCSMYIWMLSINQIVYYGRTWEELKIFLDKIEKNIPSKKIIYVHKLEFEFQFFRSHFKIKGVFARKSRKPIRVVLEDYNIEFRCSYFMTNAKLELVPKIFNLSFIKKLVGNLDYSKIRHYNTPLTDKEMAYCENDCLIIYWYIIKEREKYKLLQKIPLTSTGKIRREFKENVHTKYDYRELTRRSINQDPHVFNLLNYAFAGGYTHANLIYAGNILKNVTSYDFTSSYPYVMVSEKFPMSEFHEAKIKKFEELDKRFAYLLKIRFYNIKSKLFNTFISKNKCLLLRNSHCDNGRITFSEEMLIVITDVDLQYILKSYTYDFYIIEESYKSRYEYLPYDFVMFILQKYENKTKLKGVKGKETEYGLAKNLFNSLYGMTVTNTIRDEVKYTNENGWEEKPISNEKIIKLLIKDKIKCFLSYSWGVWITSYARKNLIENIIKFDNVLVYADTDSVKITEEANLDIIRKYNINVLNKIKKVASIRKIPIENFSPIDINGKHHPLGVFEKDAFYEKFITQGAKKYAYIEDGKIGITVAGVPKKASKTLKSLENFSSNFVFNYNDTRKKYTFLCRLSR